MSESILTSVKKSLGIAESYTVFDVDIIMHINSAFSTLHQLGIGPENGFAIEDATPTWDAFFGDDLRYNSVKSYVYTSVRLIFDPPSSAHHINALEKIKQEFEWRINVVREGDSWTDPTVSIDEDDQEIVLDGGSP